MAIGIRRREIIVALGSVGAWPLAARAAGRDAGDCYLSSGSPSAFAQTTVSPAWRCLQEGVLAY
jgi:hypothetical protein